MSCKEDKWMAWTLQRIVAKALHIPSCLIKSCHQGNSKIMILFFNKWTRVYSSMIGTLVNNTMLQAMDKKDNALVPLVPPENKSWREELLEFFEETCVQAVAKCSGIIISHPFYVLSVRMMVQFVGQETIYSGLCASVKEIYSNEGLGGFFSGIIPRLVGEVLSLLLYRGACFLVSKYAIDSEVGRSKEVQVYRDVLFQYAAGVVTHPFVLVSHMMIVNNVGLAGGKPPAMPVFDGWRDCFSYLKKTGNLWRGCSIFQLVLTKPGSDLIGQNRTLKKPESDGVGSRIGSRIGSWIGSRIGSQIGSQIM
ncbi:unnamed protein product [Pocillopora meandrina]|uniref:Uncharacterized protein n=1 Tax=Pocillopora meandrina TaxID=46732 RepID=A0AAU9Y4S1_9CNID|nr:unnamed protein product [Pocillopora meandrina]